MSEVSNLRTFDVIEPPTSAEVYKHVLKMLSPDSLENSTVSFTILGQYAVPRPEPQEITMEISRVDLNDEVKRILGRSANSLVLLEISPDPSEKATATIIGE